MAYAQRGDLKIATWFCVACGFATGFGFLALVVFLKARQARAYAGDQNAAHRVFLPCYYPLFRFLGVSYLVLSLILCIVFVTTINGDSDSNVQSRHMLVEAYLFESLVIAMIPPVLMMQSSISPRSFYRTAFYQN